jgi:hypothetical protein
MPRQLKPFIFGFVLLATISCGQREKEQDKNGGNGPNYPLTPSEQLVGDWFGIYRTMEDGKPIGDPSEVRLEFASNGILTMSLQDTSDAHVDGRWQEFQGKSLIITVTSSTMPRIGTAGKLSEFPYELQGTSLFIGNSTFQIKASKRAAENTPSPGPPTSQYWGQWRCEGTGGRTTHLKLQEPGDFTLSSVAPGERVFLAKGAIAANDALEIRLNPSAVSEPIAKGAYFKLIYRDSAKAQLVYSHDATRSISLGNCRK